ncbi:MAG: hypothetical protein WC614_08315 [bacterium]
MEKRQDTRGNRQGKKRGGGDKDRSKEWCGRGNIDGGEWEEGVFEERAILSDMGCDV